MNGKSSVTMRMTVCGDSHPSRRACRVDDPDDVGSRSAGGGECLMRACRAAAVGAREGREIGGIRRFEVRRLDGVRHADTLRSGRATIPHPRSRRAPHSAARCRGAWLVEIDLTPVDMECMRCGRTAPMRFYGICTDCRTELREKFDRAGARHRGRRVRAEDERHPERGGAQGRVAGSERPRAGYPRRAVSDLKKPAGNGERPQKPVKPPPSTMSVCPVM